MIFVTLTPVMRNDVLTLIIIPLTGKTPSLNASVAAAITLYEVYRQRGLKSFDLSKQQSPKVNTTSAELRTRYSQCRVTGHDFLDIGTGNFEQTNYPELYSGGAYFTASPENEITETLQQLFFYN